MDDQKISIRQLMEDLPPVAANLLLEGWSDAEVLAYLREAGCTPTVAKNILAKAQQSVRSRNRRKGSIISAAGFLLVLIAQYAQSTLSDPSIHLYGRSAGKAALLAQVGTPAGIVIILVGLYYVFFGRSVRSVEDEY